MNITGYPNEPHAMPQRKTIRIAGEISQAAGLALADELRKAAPHSVCLDFSEADCTTGLGMAALVRVLKQALDAGQAICALGLPQMVAHNLYRIGYYPHKLLETKDMREDEAYG